MNNHCYKVKTIDKIVDGDTIYATLETGFYGLHETKVRLLNVDAPEMFRGEDRERALGREAKKRVVELFETYKDKELWVKTKKTGKYGRWLGIFFYYNKDGSNFNINNHITEIIKDLE